MIRRALTADEAVIEAVMGIDETDDRSPAEQLRGMAAAAGKDLKEPVKRKAVLGLIQWGIASGVGEADIFELSYGDRSGRDYWNAHLRVEMTRQEVVRILAAHLASPTSTCSTITLATHAVDEAMKELPEEMRHLTGRIDQRPILESLVELAPSGLPRSLIAFLSGNDIPTRDTAREASPVARSESGEAEQSLRECAEAAGDDPAKAPKRDDWIDKCGIKPAKAMEIWRRVAGDYPVISSKSKPRTMRR